jgi:IS5 family transposase
MPPARHAPDAQLDAATWCRHLVPDGSVYAFLADHRRELFPPELLADLVARGQGHPSVPAEVVGSVMVLQALEGLSDREAVSALRRDIAWKVACGLRLDDEGFHPTVLVYWRGRLRASERPRRVFDAVRQVIEQTGVLAGRGRRVLDSTILEDAVATQDTVTQLVAAIRRVRRLVPAARGVELTAHDYERPGKPACAWDDAEARQALVSGLVGDALRLLATVADPGLDAEQAEAVALLALVAGQDVEPGERPGTWRIARKVARDRVVSTVDPQARHARKTSAHKRAGYKAHVAAEPATGLVTECALTAASTPDGPTGVGLLAGEAAGLEVLGDSAYGSGETRAALRTAGHVQTIKPLPLAAAVPGGFTVHEFQVDQQAARSPARPATRPGSPPRGRPASPATASATHCVSAARPPPAGARSASTRTRTSCAPRAAVPPPAASKQATGAGGRWWNARSPGWSPTAAGGCPTAASSATMRGCRCGSPRSTCAACSPSALPAGTAPGCSPDRPAGTPGLPALARQTVTPSQRPVPALPQERPSRQDRQLSAGS